MRILFSANPVGGHLLPMVPMIEAGRRSGHRIAVLTGAEPPPGSDGLELLIAGPDIWTVKATTERQVGGPWTLPGPEAAEMFAGTRVDLSFDEALTQARAFRPDLIICETLDYVGRAVAAALRCPWARFAVSGGMPATIVGPLAERWESQLQKRRLDAEPPPICEFDPYPDLLHGPQAHHDTCRRPIQPVPLSAAGADRSVTAAFSSPEPVVLLTLGTTAEDPELADRMSQSLASAGLNVLVTHDGADAGRIRHLGFVPLGPVVEQVAAVVSLGGTGTVLTSLWAGRPLALLPMIADQPINAQRVADVGAGVVVDQSEALGEQTRAMLTAGRYAAAAARVRQELITLPSPGEALDRLVAQVNDGVGTTPARADAG